MVLESYPDCSTTRLIGVAGRARCITIGAARIRLEYGRMESCAQGRGCIGEYLVVAHSCEVVQDGIGGGVGGVSS
jgi:hypothetical protein